MMVPRLAKTDRFFDDSAEIAEFKLVFMLRNSHLVQYLTKNVFGF